ncbi:hypothetical protein HOP52_04410 [Halomonas campisalis]|uniref:Uncharacterized protein n=1 Tax=Billgrantia campisalis TaxID=74661 RepID=A0ABS9P5H9_9GAMM|nr:hypothetical protein [Halomonas campisalis]MCG6657019.1 hypothetical protein [Halomonas campisalis]MDR5862204.1 hypothetical protein [Halomonas campisalis]
MTYVLVMGSLALSVLFTLGWALWRGLRWVAGLLPGGVGGRARSPRKPARQAAAGRKAPAKSARPAATASSKPNPKPSRPPWALTRWLAGCQAALPLAAVGTLTYLVARLAEHGMSFRPPHAAPGGFHSLVTALGWLAAGLVLLALVAWLAAWRCRRAG